MCNNLQSSFSNLHHFFHFSWPRPSWTWGCGRLGTHPTVARSCMIIPLQWKIGFIMIHVITSFLFWSKCANSQRLDRIRIRKTKNITGARSAVTPAKQIKNDRQWQPSKQPSGLWFSGSFVWICLVDYFAFACNQGNFTVPNLLPHVAHIAQISMEAFSCHKLRLNIWVHFHNCNNRSFAAVALGCALRHQAFCVEGSASAPESVSCCSKVVQVKADLKDKGERS